MTDEQKFIIIGIISAAAVYFVRSIAGPLLFPNPSSWEWIARELPVYSVVAVLTFAGLRMLWTLREAARAHRNLQQAAELRDAISRYFVLESEESLYSKVLTEITTATGSPHGVFGYIDVRGNLVCPSLKDRKCDLMEKAGRGAVFRPGTWTGLWGSALAERRLRWSNADATAAGVQGTARVVAVPILRDRELIGLIVVGGKPGDYSAADRALLQHLADHIGPLLSRRLEVDEACEPGGLGTKKQVEQIKILQDQRIQSINVTTGILGEQFSRAVSVIGAEVLPHIKDKHRQMILEQLRTLLAIGLRCVNLTRQLLFLNHKHKISVAPVDMSLATHGMLNTIGGLLGDDIRVMAHLEPEIWLVQADRAAIEQVLIGLSINARGAMQAGGRLRIDAENVTIREGEHELIENARPGNFVCVSVTDDGCGMDKQQLRRAFDSPSLIGAKNELPATGLSMARDIVKQHEGWINAYSEPGRGTTFKIYLPALAIAEEDNGGPSKSCEISVGAGERVLLVEDEDEIREMLTLILTQNGYEVAAAADANNALSTFRRENGRFDLLFSDVVLPDQDGISLARMLTDLKPGLPVLLTSGYMDAEKQWRIQCDMGYSFISKPFSVAIVLKEVSRAVARAGSVEKTSA